MWKKISTLDQSDCWITLGGMQDSSSIQIQFATCANGKFGKKKKMAKKILESRTGKYDFFSSYNQAL